VPTRALAATVLLLAVAGLGVYGMGRSLWLDEAWVANSIQAPSLAGMFYYPDWLQVNPPLFLLLARAAVRVLGASNAAFRLVPLLLAVAAAAGMLAVSRRLLRPGFALLAAAVVAFDPTAIEYSRTLKPYSGELAAAALLLLTAVRYLQQPDRRRFLWLLAAIAAAMPLAYSAVFIVPGMVLAIAANGGLRRGAVLAALAGGVLLAMYWFSIRPNLAPELHDFWAADADHGMTAGLWAALAFCIATAIQMGRTLWSSPSAGIDRKRDWAAIVCLAPCLLLAASGTMGWYPVSHRTRLFALPCFTLLAMLTAEDLLLRWLNRGVLEATALALAIGIAGHAALTQTIERRAAPEEDFAAAVRFLEPRIRPADLVLVHACCKEGFLLYSGMDGWNSPRLLFGDTGWPCCARGKDARPGRSTELAVTGDLDAKIPRGYSGRIWLLFTTRPTHWSYVGLNEGELWRKHLWERGCPPGPYLRFENLAVSPMDCVDAR
jgi:mannosyltransferase